MVLFVKSGLLIFDAKLSVHRGNHPLYLSHGEHSSEERVAGIISPGFIAKHGHAVVYSHWQSSDVGIVAPPLLFSFKDAGQLYDVGSSAEMTGLREVAVWEDMARPQVYKPSAMGIFLS